MQVEARERVTAWGLEGGGYYPPGMPVDMAVAEDSAGGPASRVEAPAATTAAAQDVGYSGTNTQEVGVDEGDIVETDGSYVYVAGQDGLRIVSVADANVVASPELPGGSHQMILDGSRLLVATQGYTTAEDTVVSVFDVSDPTNPTLLRRSHLEGRLVASRATDGTVRLVLSSSLAARLPFVHPDQFGLDEERSLERNKQIIDESAVQDWLPRWFDEAGDGTFGQMEESLDCANVAAPRDFSGLGITWIASIDLDGEATPVGFGRHRVDRRDGVRLDDQPLRRHPVVGLELGRPAGRADRRPERGAADPDPHVHARRGRLGHVPGFRRGARPAAQPVRDERARGRPPGRHDDRRLEHRRERHRPCTPCGPTATSSNSSRWSTASAPASRSTPCASSARRPTS